MASNTTEANLLLEQWRGQIMPRSFNGGFVTLSYVVSLIGAASTLELINRRTGNKGRINHLLLVTAAVTMGGIAIWCMHYIGNRAIDIGNGDPQLQIAYSSGFTALSFFMPILVLLTAFIAIGTNEKVSWWRVAVGGTLAGAAICGMHYLGNASISNYVCIYNAANVVGAALIAVAASIVALSVFFVFRAAWTNLLWKRGMSAIVLAGAVSGMHWCASTGTQYRLIALAGTNQLSRNTTVIVVICLSVLACLIMAGFAMYTARIMQRYANKAQQVVLAAAVFDKHGRVLVSTDGLLPSEKITDSFLEKTPQDSFTVAHPLFHWMFQASRNWSSITSIIGGIRNHLSHLPHRERDNSREGIKLITDHGDLIDNYEIIFRELFCAAAAGLADKMKTPLTNVGILWDEILATGGGGHAAHVQARRRQQDVERIVDNDGLGPRREGGLPEGTTKVSSFEDLAEKGLFSRQQGQQEHQQAQEFGRGSLMFLVRRVDNNRDMESLTAAGYRFAELHQVSGIIGSTMQIKTRGIEYKLRNMAAYAEENGMLEPGVHVALFGVRARVNNAYGFDALARRNVRNLLPSVQMPLVRLDAWQINFLRQFDRMTPHQIARRLDNLHNLQPRDMMFISQLTDSIEALRGWIEDAIFDEAVLCSKTVEAPCRPVSPGTAPGTCTVITFRIVIPIHLNIESPKCEFVPLNLLKVHQLVYKDSPNHLVFTRSVHREIAPIINAVPLVQQPSKAAIGHSRRTSLREAKMSSRIFRFARPHTSSNHSGGGSSGSGGGSNQGAVDMDGNPIPMVLYRTSSTAASEQTGSTQKLWNGRPGSSDERSRGIGSIDMGSEGLHPPPPAYMVNELHSPTSLMMVHPPITVPSPPPTMLSLQQQQQQSSFGGIMVSQEITVNVQTAGDVSDASPGHVFHGNGRQTQSRTGTLLRRRSEGGDVPTIGGAAESSEDARRLPYPSDPSVPPTAGSGLMNSGGVVAGGVGGSMVGIGHAAGPTVGIEMRPLATDRASVHIGSGVQVSNVEAEKLTESHTFVDELFSFCVEGR